MQYSIVKTKNSYNHNYLSVLNNQEDFDKALQKEIDKNKTTCHVHRMKSVDFSLYYFGKEEIPISFSTISICWQYRHLWGCFIDYYRLTLSCLVSTDIYPIYSRNIHHIPPHCGLTIISYSYPINLTSLGHRTEWTMVKSIWLVKKKA